MEAEVAEEARAMLQAPATAAGQATQLFMVSERRVAAPGAGPSALSYLNTPS